MGTRRSCDFSQMVLGDSSQTDAFGFNEVLVSEIVNALGSYDHIGSSLDDKVQSILQDVHLLLPDFLEVLWVINQDLDTHLHLKFI